MNAVTLLSFALTTICTLAIRRSTNAFGIELGTGKLQNLLEESNSTARDISKRFFNVSGKSRGAESRLTTFDIHVNASEKAYSVSGRRLSTEDNHATSTKHGMTSSARVHSRFDSSKLIEFSKRQGKEIDRQVSSRTVNSSQSDFVQRNSSLEASRERDDKVIEGDMRNVLSVAIVMQRIHLSEPWLLFSICIVVVVCCLWAILYRIARRLKYFQKGGDFDEECPLDEIAFENVASPEGSFHCLGLSHPYDAEVLTVPALELPCVTLERVPWNENVLSQILEGCGVPVATWTAAAKHELTKDLLDGQCRLMAHGENMVRVTEQVLIFIEYVHPSKTLVLLEKLGKQTLLERTPFSRRRVDETIFDTAQRQLEEKFKIPPDMALVDESIMDTTEIVEMGEYYRGLVSMLRKFVVRIEVSQVSVEKLTSVASALGAQSGGGGVEYEWLPKDKAMSVLQQAKEKSSSSLNALGSSIAFDALQEPALPWTSKSLGDILKKRHVRSPESHFGIPIDTLVKRLNDGYISLGLRQHDVRLVCVEEVVVLWVECDEGVFVERDGFACASCSQKKKGRRSSTAIGGAIGKYNLPFAKKFSNEDVMHTARRIAFAYFNASAWVVTVEDHEVEEVEARGALQQLLTDERHKYLEQRVYLVRAHAEKALYRIATDEGV
mmetsp:Transcript_10234/g.16671  ORF Transcript_10234/g.16671 Transcript_10234/m.16671 type:complete len:666 (+) Transcript_10234:51-2048(+)|eukprot:CAMPEP_0169349196 /NCGR_PEP_ID=MMETSP1017-20121227/23585_1 /TAXON_ID=342587 /ORGANISM="Karlodinium micrum, Strain CCMP2283" /LENGTH=665 /DNA_ID=CAMNT_0009445311 /DNA_START=41 /DNA_END=2038 /DNA_ORIENTATION=-